MTKIFNTQHKDKSCFHVIIFLEHNVREFEHSAAGRVLCAKLGEKYSVARVVERHLAAPLPDPVDDDPGEAVPAADVRNKVLRGQTYTVNHHEAPLNRLVTDGAA